MNRTIPGEFDLMQLLLSSLYESEVFNNCHSSFLREVNSPFVTHPAMDTSTTTVHPQEVLESKIL